MKYQFQIWQVKEEYERDFAFRRFDSLKGEIKKDRYQKVYDSEVDYEFVDSMVVLEEIFRMFNVERPLDFKGHSLSVSDVVVIDGVAYYCDSFGFKKVEW